MTKLRSMQLFAWVYGAAHGGKSLIWQASELLFAFFLTEICGLPPREMGIILGVSLLLNAFVDLALGRTLARWIHTVAQAGRVQFVGVCIAGAAFVAFGLSGLVPPDHRFAYALGAILLFRLAYPVVDNPQNAMLALATTSDAQRAGLAGVRYIAAGLAGMAIGGVFSVVIGEGGGQAARFAVFTQAIVVVAVVAALGLARFSANSISTVASGDPDLPARSGAIESGALRAMPVFLMIFCFSGCNAVFIRLQSYFAAAVIGPDARSGWVIMAISAATVVSQLLWTPIARRIGLVSTLRIALGLWAVASMLFWLVGAHGLVPAALVGLVYGAANGGVLMLLWALAAASARPGLAKSSATATFGKLTFSSKLAMAAASLAVAELLVSTDYHSVGAFTQQLLPAMALVPAAGAAASLIASIYLRRGDPPASSAGRETLKTQSG